MPAVEVTVTPATVVVRVGGRRSSAGSHGLGQNGDLLGRPGLERCLAAAPEAVIVVIKVHPAASRTAHRHVHAAGPATPRWIGNRCLDGGCGFIESFEK